MKILFTVEFYEPQKGGAQEVVKQLAERLVMRGHQVCVATGHIPARKDYLLNGVTILDFQLSGNAVRGYKGGQEEIKRYQQTLLDPSWDAIINYAAQVWTTDLTFPILNRIATKKILVPCGYSGLRSPAYKTYFADLPTRLSHYDKLVYLSPNYQDRQFGIEHHLDDKAVIIPNGAAAEEFSGPLKFDIKKELQIDTSRLIITVATHHRDKGHTFVIDAFKKMKRQDATLLIIGENPGTDLLRKVRHFFTGCYKNCWYSSLLDRQIRLMSGGDRQRVVSSYKQADLFLLGSKVECAPLVMYESFAAGVPFVSTPVGNVPDYAEIVSLANTPEEMARAGSELLDSPSKREEIKQKSLALWQEKYTWDKITEQYESVIRN